ncbi:MAG: GNAT family N-acetyltransferase, partial [Pseudomonadota bacterium]
MKIVVSLEWRVERTCTNAWPAPRQVWIGDWMLRLAPGVSRRANSLNPMVATAAAIDETIASASVILCKDELPLLFRIPDLIDPFVDAALEARGFTAEGRTNTLYADIGALLAAMHQDVQILPG